MVNDLRNINEVVELINNKRKLILAADEAVLDKLPKGDWIGGTIPYFMASRGGVYSKEEIFVNDITDYLSEFKLLEYDSENIQNIVSDRFENGFSYLLLPGFSDVLFKYAIIAQELVGIYDVPLTGWVTGIDLDGKENQTPKVFNGLTKEKFDDKAIALHVKLEDKKIANLEIINVFTQGSGDCIEFIEEDFVVKDCMINGEKRNFCEYVVEERIDIRFPLVANYSGAMINISIKDIDEKNSVVHLYSPVRKNIEYKFAHPTDDYLLEFNNKLPKEKLEVASSFNCILNYVYSDLKGKQTGIFKGPFTFGEIAYILVNQTLVYLTISSN